MSEDRNLNEFVIPQKGAAKKFRELLSRGNFRRAYLVTASGDSLVDLPVKINPGGVLPRPFWAPAQAVVTVVSIFARLINVKLVLEVENNE